AKNENNSIRGYEGDKHNKPIKIAESMGVKTTIPLIIFLFIINPNKGLKRQGSLRKTKIKVI
ncbi:MAG: hypothetical protein ACOCUT_01005, partial [bacterium]